MGNKIPSLTQDEFDEAVRTGNVKLLRRALKTETLTKL